MCVGYADANAAGRLNRKRNRFVEEEPEAADVFIENE